MEGAEKEQDTKRPPVGKNPPPPRTHDLLLGVSVGAEQVHGLHVPEVDVVAQQEDEEQLAHILLLAVAIQGLVACGKEAGAGQKQDSGT